MKIVKYQEISPRYFDSEQVKGVTGRVLIGKADGAKNFCMRLFEISKGGYSPCHQHDWEHEIFIHSGKGEALNGDEWIPISAGNAIFIPSNQKHQIRNTGDEPLIFLCLIPSGVPEI